MRRELQFVGTQRRTQIGQLGGAELVAQEGQQVFIGLAGVAFGDLQEIVDQVRDVGRVDLASFDQDDQLFDRIVVVAQLTTMRSKSWSS